MLSSETDKHFQKLSDIDENLRYLRDQLDKKDALFKAIEDDVNKQTAECLDLVADLKTWEKQSQIIETRYRNEMNFKNCIFS